MKKLLVLLIFFLLTVNGNSIANWEECSNGLECKVIRGLAVSGDTLFVGTYGAGVYCSTDLGNNWFPRNAGMEDDSISRVVIRGSTMFSSSYRRYVYKSSDFGITWIQKKEGMTYNQVFKLATSGDNVYCGTNYHGLFRSTDDGETWAAVNNGLSNNPYIYIMSLSVKNDIVYAGIQPRGNMNGFGLYKSTDNCESWKCINGNVDTIDYFLNIIEIVFKENDIYLATALGGIYYSDDNGENWTSKNNGLIIDPWSGNYISLSLVDNDLFLGTLTKGVFWSPDDAEQWLDVSYGKSFKNVRAVKQCADYLFMATDSGMYRIKRNEIISSIDQINELSISSIFPNPASDYIEINLERCQALTKCRTFGINIYNTFGELVISEAGHLEEIGHLKRIDISHLPAGVYFLKIGNKAEKFVKI